MLQNKILKKPNSKAHWLEKILLSGPFLIGWLYGVVRFSPDQRLFQISFFSFVVFVVYLFFLAFMRLFVFFFLDLQFLFFINSILAAGYLLVGFYNIYIVLFNKEAKKIFLWSNKILKKILLA